MVKIIINNKILINNKCIIMVLKEEMNKYYQYINSNNNHIIMHKNNKMNDI